MFQQCAMIPTGSIPFFQRILNETPQILNAG